MGTEDKKKTAGKSAAKSGTSGKETKSSAAKKAAPKAKEESARPRAAATKRPARKVKAAKVVIPEREFAGSSRAPKKAAETTGPSSETPTPVETAIIDETDELSPLERKLADAVLPELPREDRARLQMQSPTRLYFYWSIKNNPFQTLNKALGDATGSYTLVVKLVNRTRGTEEIYRVEPEGNWWFNVDPDCEYRGEVGFFAPNRPYIRIVYSNTIRTPRRTPSWRTDYIPRFTVTANQFAEVLDASGYSRDAFEVALAGDDKNAADELTRTALSGLLGRAGFPFDGFDGDELRFVLLALASGYSIEDLEGHISQALFERLSGAGARVSAEQALAALKEHFDVDTEEITEYEETGPAVFGLSAVHFPRRMRTRSVPKKLLSKLSKFDTISSSR